MLDLEKRLDTGSEFFKFQDIYEVVLLMMVVRV